MPFREKTAWISVATTLLIWGYYCLRAIPALASGSADSGEFVGLFVGCTILSVIVQIVLIIIVSVAAPGDANTPADERERMFALKSERIAYFFLAAIVATVALASPVVIGASPDLFPRDPLGSAVLIMGNGILLGLIVAELVRAGAIIVHYRRSV